MVGPAGAPSERPVAPAQAGGDISLSGHGRGDAVSEASGAPSQPDGSGTIAVATWNVRSGRRGGMESACRALASLAVDIALLQETKLTGGIHTKFSSGYSIFATDAADCRNGGVALVWKDGGEAYEVEEVQTWSPNVISFQLVTGCGRFYIVGAYLHGHDRGEVGPAAVLDGAAASLRGLS